MKTTISAVKAACNRILSETFPDIRIYGNTTFDGYERPSFFTEISPVGYRPTGLCQKQVSYAFTATYFEKLHDEQQCLEIFEKIQEAAGAWIRAGERKIPVAGISMDWVGNTMDKMQIRIDLQTIVEVKSKEEEGDQMEDLELRLEKEE